jgi:hypothetical protein
MHAVRKCRSHTKPRRRVFNALVARGAARTCRGTGPRQGIAANGLAPTMSHRPVFPHSYTFRTLDLIGGARASLGGVWIP